MTKYDTAILQNLLLNNQHDEAKKYCEEWLKNEPSSEALNSCGLLFVKLNDLSSAQSFFEQAIKVDPHVLAFHNNLSNVHVAKGNIDKAKQHLLEALRLNPQHAEIYNNLGRLLYKQGLFTDAIAYYKKALRINPKFWQAHYNLAHSYSMQNQLESAIIHYKEVLTIFHDHLNAHFNLGLLYFKKEDFINAKYHLKEATKDQSNIIAIQFLANTQLALGEIEGAIALYEKIRDNSLDPQVHHNLAILYLRQNEREKALRQFEYTVKLDPNNQTANHMLKALSGEASDFAPKSFVADLFDQYADYYDDQARNSLHYQVPAKLREAIGLQLGEKLRIGRILDLGCGTGLCGIYFRDLARELIGVDLSSKMLDKAKSLGAYDVLVQKDLVEYLSDPKIEPFDIIIAGDVLVYFGELNNVFELISKKLTTRGRFLFTTENSEEKDYILMPSGRFAHSNFYIETLSKKYNLEIELNKEIVPRINANVPVKGNLYICNYSCSLLERPSFGNLALKI